MDLFRRREMMDPLEIGALAGLRPLFDPVFDHLLEGACGGTVEVFSAAVGLELIRPFDPDYDPCKHPVGQAAVDDLVTRWSEGQWRPAWVYQQRQEFILSDDYIIWLAAKRVPLAHVPCLILGKPLHQGLRDLRGPLEEREVLSALGFPSGPRSATVTPQTPAERPKDTRPQKASSHESVDLNFSVGLWDWLFGEKATLDLPNGGVRTVTVKWLKRMEQKSALAFVPPHVGEMIDVHFLGRGDPLADKDVRDIDTWIAGNRRTYRKGRWCVGKDVLPEQVHEHWDSDSASLHVVYRIVDERWKALFVTRPTFEELRRIEEELLP